MTCKQLNNLIITIGHSGRDQDARFIRNKNAISHWNFVSDLVINGTHTILVELSSGHD